MNKSGIAVTYSLNVTVSPKKCALIQHLFRVPVVLNTISVLRFAPPNLIAQWQVFDWQRIFFLY